MTHHQYSPSKLEALSKCPCFQSSPHESSDAADEGTLIHKALETQDPAILETDSQQKAYEYCTNTLNRMLTTLQERRPRRKIIIHRELRLSVDSLTRGTADVVALCPRTKTLLVLDWKCGQVPVDPPDQNIQLLAYIAGAFQRYPSYTKAYGAIVMPRAPEHTAMAEFTREAIDHFTQKTKVIIQAVEDPFKLPTAGWQCRYCCNKSRCPALHKTAMRVVGEQNLLPLPPRPLLDPTHSVEPIDLAKAMLVAKVLPDWCSQVKSRCTAYALENIDTPDIIPGFALRRRAGGLKVINPREVVDLLEEIGIEKQEILEDTATISMSKIADLLLKHQAIPELKTKRDYLDALEETLGPAVARQEDVVYLQKSRRVPDQELATMLIEQGATKPTKH